MIFNKKPDWITGFSGSTGIMSLKIRKSNHE